MDAFLAKKSFKSEWVCNVRVWHDKTSLLLLMLIFLDIVKTYNQMLADELKPDITSYRLATFGHILLVSIILFYFII